MGFDVSSFIWRPFIHLDLSFVKSDKPESIFIPQHGNIKLELYHLLKMHFFPIVWFWLFFYQNSRVYICVGLFLELWFNSIDQGVVFYTNTMQFLPLLFFSDNLRRWFLWNSFLIQDCFRFPEFLGFLSLFLSLFLFTVFAQVLKNSSLMVYKKLYWNFNGVVLNH